MNVTQFVKFEKSYSVEELWLKLVLKEKLLLKMF